MTQLQEIADWYRARLGRHLGYSDWLEITAESVAGFADATRDWQWIHLDPARAAAEGPYEGPVAHGFFTLSLVPYLTSALLDLSWTELGINYRVDRVRFRAPVPVGGRIRAGATLTSARVRPGDYLELVLAVVIELEGSPVPACTLDHARLYRVIEGAGLPKEEPDDAVLDSRP